MLIIAFPVFTVLFLTVSYFAGLYDNGYRQSRLNKSTLTAMLVILAVYSLLPESLRFSRGILFFGTLLAFVFMSVIRLLLLKWNMIESALDKDEVNETIIAGSESEFEDVVVLLEKSGMQERILGRIETGDDSEKKTIGKLNDLASLLKKYPVKEIIFCEGSLSFKKIIESISLLQRRIRIKIFTSCSNTLIGSESSKAVTFLAGESNYRLSSPMNRRNKNLIDIVLAIFFLATFPFHFIFKKKPLLFFKHTFAVLLRKKTWIGYALDEKDLPPLKKGILTSTGLPASLNTLSQKNLRAADILYAKEFQYRKDLRLVWSNYRLLS